MQGYCYRLTLLIRLMVGNTQFITLRDFHAADVEKRDILALYEDDIKKAAKKYKSKASAIFDKISR